MTIFKNGIDTGYLKTDNPLWWFDEKNPHAFRIANLDEDYPAEYFPLAEPPKEAVEAIVTFCKEYYEKITNSLLSHVIEFGCGGGWIGAEFIKNGIVYRGVEGSLFGYRSAVQRINPSCVQINDLRKMISLADDADIVVCTEVAEHIDPPFHATLVENLTSHADLVWFSSEEPGTNPPHLHHPGEMPLKYWQNLFEFFGYGCYMLPDSVFAETHGRGRCIFYNKSTIKI